MLIYDDQASQFQKIVCAVLCVCEQGVRIVNVAQVTDKMLATETNPNNININTSD